MRIFVIHGYQAAPGDHWFPWLKSTFESDAVSVDIVALPNPNEPSPGAWIETLHHAIGRPDSQTVIVAHSLGCIAALRYLHSVGADWSLKGLILVAGFAENVPSLPLLDPFVTDSAFVDTLHIPHCTVIGSDTDSVVPPSLTSNLAARLGAEMITVHDGGHFRGKDGYLEFADVGSTLEKLLR